jgi:hypothetical protein
LPEGKPQGRLTDIGGYTVKDPANANWQPPKFAYDADLATKPKLAKVIVLVYNPKLKSQGGKTLIEHVKGSDPRKCSHILADTIHTASGGYVTYQIVDVIEVDGYSEKADGFRYTEETYLAARKNPDKLAHRPDRSSYRKIFEENKLTDRVRNEGVTEIWLWGAGWFGYDELAMYIPKRYARFAPTSNAWFYRPYEIPPECGRTVWVMGFNYEAGADNMLHSYSHRCESMLALQFGRGVWDKSRRDKDPWNTFASVETDDPGKPSHVGNCHVPPNGLKGYDYNNKRSVLSYADNWLRYPDLSGEPRLIGSDEWNHTQFGYQQWWLSHIPKAPGFTKWGYNNWWVYIANVDEDLPDRPVPAEVGYPEK